jgi:hypothetical protein
LPVASDQLPANLAFFRAAPGQRATGNRQLPPATNSKKPLAKSNALESGGAHSKIRRAIQRFESTA